MKTHLGEVEYMDNPIGAVLAKGRKEA